MDELILGIVKAIKKVESGVPATAQQVTDAEALLGFPFPEILKHIYLEVSNGGIGPGYQILGVNGGQLSDEGDSIAELYASFSSEILDDPLWKWPKGLVPFCHWGCAIYSCFDTTKEGCPIVWFDPNMRESGEPMDIQFFSHKPSIEIWFQEWLDGIDFWEETFGE